MCGWVSLSQLGSPSQIPSWAGATRNSLLELSVANCIQGRAGSTWLAQRAWAQVPSQAMGLCQSHAALTVRRVGHAGPWSVHYFPLCQAPWLPCFQAFPRAAQVLALGLGNCWRSFFPLSGARKLIYSVNLN